LMWRGLETGSRRTYTGTKLETADTAKGSLRSTAPVLDPTLNSFSNEELCRIVEEAIDLYRKDGKPLPPPTSGRDFANKMQNVA